MAFLHEMSPIMVDIKDTLCGCSEAPLYDGNDGIWMLQRETSEDTDSDQYQIVLSTLVVFHLPTTFLMIDFVCS